MREKTAGNTSALVEVRRNPWKSGENVCIFFSCSDKKVCLLIDSSMILRNTLFIKEFALTPSRRLIHYAKQPVCNKWKNSDERTCRAKLEPVVFQKIAFLRMNFICKLAEVKVKLRWIHIVPGQSYPGRVPEVFFSLTLGKIGLRPMQQAACRKKKPLSQSALIYCSRWTLIFFYPITFKPITAYVSHGSQ